MAELHEISDEIQSDASDGVSDSDSVMKLHERGMSVVGSVRIIRKAYGLSLGDAKETVADHRVWKSLTESVKPFHDELIGDIERTVFSDGERRNDFRNRYEILLMKKSELEKQLEIIQSELGAVNSEIISIKKETANFRI
ncbi:hypothetical protein QUF80_24000 [Desulfococcaceae bacterium HSG8]|nr:hypothetical protein [Desulfococcaceae bacterium HSG8]